MVNEATKVLRIKTIIKRGFMNKTTILALGVFALGVTSVDVDAMAWYCKCSNGNVAFDIPRPGNCTPSGGPPCGMGGTNYTSPTCQDFQDQQPQGVTCYPANASHPGPAKSEKKEKQPNLLNVFDE
jgi:hypothetical protein